MIPKGWYFCAESSEIRPETLIEKKLFDQKIILWRTKKGILHICRSVCPHLGSDLGKLGRVIGEHLRCFSHDYTYNGDGDCVATGQGTLPMCHKRVLTHFPIQEKAGFVLIWFSEKNQPPTWDIPDDVFSLSSKHYIRSDFEFEVPLETINEDNFDVGHLYKWHNVYNVKTTPVEMAGPMISISHRFNRHSILMKKPLKPPFDWLTKEIHSQYSSTLHGHGLTNSFIDIFNLNIHMQDLIWCTPITAKRTMYTTFVRLLPQNPSKWRMLSYLLRPLIFRACVWRLRQEHIHEGYGFWEKQTRVLNPILTAAEHQLIGPYRQWCMQFMD